LIFMRVYQDLSISGSTFLDVDPDLLIFTYSRGQLD